jgi:hypothetical protein
MMGQPTRVKMPGILRCFAAAIRLFIGLIPVLGHAQTNIDQGKSPAEIFANDCATCHKSARGLANGRGSSGLASFLVEHYTASKDQAASLAAYVMGAGGGDAVPAAQGRGAKPAPDHARAAVEEPKPGGAQPARQTGKPEEEGTPATARLQPPAGEEPKRPGDVPSIIQEPHGGASGRKPAAGRPEPATANRGRPKEQSSPPAQQPAAATAEPGSTGQDASPAIAPTAAGPSNADSGEGAPVPRDNIPD